MQQPIQLMILLFLRLLSSNGPRSYIRNAIYKTQYPRQKCKRRLPQPILSNDLCTYNAV